MRFCPICNGVSRDVAVHCYLAHTKREVIQKLAEVNGSSKCPVCGQEGLNTESFVAHVDGLHRKNEVVEALIEILEGKP